MKITIRKTVLHILFLLLLLAITKNFFDIIPDEWQMTNIATITLLIISIIILFLYQTNNVTYKFGGYILALIICVVISAVQEKNLFGQPILMGILPQRTFLVALISYFPMRKLFSIKKINVEWFFHGLMYLGTLSCLLYIVQKAIILNGGPQFIYVASNFFGYFSGYRMYVGSSLIILSTIIATTYFLDTLKIKYFFHVLVGWITQLWITQGRIEMITLIIVTVICVFIQGKLNVKKMTYFAMMSIGLWLITLTPVFQNIVAAIMKVDGAGRGTDTLTIRNLGRVMYWEQLNESSSTLIFGTGYPNFQFAPAFFRTGFTKNIFLTDNGFMTFFYIFGIIGVVIVLLMVIKYLRLSFKYLQSSGQVIPFLYMTSLVIVGYNIILWYWELDGTFLLILMLCALEQAIDNRKMEVKRTISG